MATSAGPSRAPDSPSDLEEPKRLRVYEDWQGAEVFFCGGRCMAGPSWKSTIGTASMIIVPSVVFWALVVPKFLSNIGLASLIWAISLALTSLSLSFLFTTACIDPGVIPRNPEPDADYIAGKKPRTTEVMVNGQPVIVRYNETCGYYQPPRAHHCSVNDNCIERFDHHCPWVGTTIGKRNYRFFLLFVFTTTILCLYTCGICLYQLFYSVGELESASPPASAPTAPGGNNTNSGDFDAPGSAPSNSMWLEVISQSIPSIVVLAYCFLLTFFVGGLSGFHAYLVSTNQTTYENFRYANDTRPNPYNQGCFKNCAEVFCTPILKRQVDPRAFVDEWNPVIPDIQHMQREESQSVVVSSATSSAYPAQMNGTHVSAASNGTAQAAPVSAQSIEIEMVANNGEASAAER